MIWVILRRWRLIVAVGMLVGSFAGGYRLAMHQWRVADLIAEAARLSDALAAAEQTAAVLRAHYVRQTKLIDALDGQARDFENLEGRDAPLSDHLRAVSSRLWR